MASITYPGLKTPPVWQKLQYVFTPAQYLESVRQAAPDIANTPVFGSDPTVITVSHPDGLRQLFNRDRKQFVAPRNPLVQPVVGDRSLFMMEGDRHRRERKLLMPPFHGDRLRSYGETICQISRDRMAAVPVGESFRMHDIAQAVTLEIILQVIFGLDGSDRSQQIAAKVFEFTSCFRSKIFLAALFISGLRRDFGPFKFWSDFQRLRSDLNALIVEEIRDRRANPDPSRTDMLSLLLAAMDEDGNPMEEEELYDELITLLVAGHETSANTIAWVSYWTHREPGMLQRLREELAAANGAEPAAIARLPYLDAVCKEAMRIAPTVMMTGPRRTAETVEMLGYTIPKDTLIYGNIYNTHHNPHLYPEPERFNPDRFFDRQFTPYEFLPYGGGVRRCLGEALADYEVRLAVATIVGEFSLESAEAQPERPVRRGVNLTPERGVLMRRLG